MRAATVIISGFLLASSAALAGPNDGAVLAMHTIASWHYLYCPELTDPNQYLPAHCGLIDNSASLSELDVSYGYVYVVFLAYNVTAMTGVEFSVCCWPSWRAGAPAPPTKHIPPLLFCPENSLVLGDPFSYEGGIQTFGEVVTPTEGCGGVLAFAWTIYYAFYYPQVLPLRIDYIPSSHSYPSDPHNYVLGPGPGFEEDRVVEEHGCTLGWSHDESVPYADCSPGGTRVEARTWSGIKVMYR